MSFMQGVVFVGGVLLGTCSAVSIIHMHKSEPQEVKQVQEVKEDTIDSVEVVTLTEVLLDKRVFICNGDIDLKISEVGVVDFVCRTEGKKYHFTTNPQDIFVTRTFEKVPANFEEPIIEEEIDDEE